MLAVGPARPAHPLGVFMQTDAVDQGKRQRWRQGLPLDRIDTADQLLAAADGLNQDAWAELSGPHPALLVLQAQWAEQVQGEGAAGGLRISFRAVQCGHAQQMGGAAPAMPVFEADALLQGELPGQLQQRQVLVGQHTDDHQIKMASLSSFFGLAMAARFNHQWGGHVLGLGVQQGLWVGVKQLSIQTGPLGRAGTVFLFGVAAGDFFQGMAQRATQGGPGIFGPEDGLDDLIIQSVAGDG